MKRNTLNIVAAAVVSALATLTLTATLLKRNTLPSFERTDPGIYTRGLSGADYYVGPVNPAILEVGQQVDSLGYSVQWYHAYPERLDQALAYGVPINLTWSPYHLAGHHPIDDSGGAITYMQWCAAVLPDVAQKVPNPTAILLNTENLTVEQGSKRYHDLAYEVAKRYWPDTPVYWYGPYWADKFDPEVKTDAVSARIYWPWDISRSMRDYTAAVVEANARGQKVIAWVALGSGYVANDDTKWNWVDPYDYDTASSKLLGQFLATQWMTLEAVQLYPAPKDGPVWLKHFEAFMVGWNGTEG